MAEQYEIERVKLQRHEVLVLKPRNKKSTFLGDLARRKSTLETYKAIAREMERVADNGVDWALRAERITPIKQSKKELPLYELRCPIRSSNRVMTHIHNTANGPIPIYLFYFVGHQRNLGGGGITEEDLKKGARYAKAAEACLSANE